MKQRDAGDVEQVHGQHLVGDSGHLGEDLGLGAVQVGLED